MTARVEADVVAAFDAALYDNAEHIWGGGFAGSPYSAAELKLYREIVGSLPAEALPTRMTTPTFHLDRLSQGGPALGEEGLPFDEIAPALAKQAAARGWRLDGVGRPVHPHAALFAEDAFIGLPVGLGQNRWYGERVIVKVATHNNGRLALIRSVDGAGRSQLRLPTAEMTHEDLEIDYNSWMTGSRDVEPDALAAVAVRICDEHQLPVTDEHEICVIRAMRPVLPTTMFHSWELVFLLEIAEVRAEPSQAKSLVRMANPASFKPSMNRFDRSLIGALQ